jgi:hypothetical protein
VNDVAYVTQEMWDRAQDALRAALPIIEQHTPRLSTAGTMVSVRDKVRAAIVTPIAAAMPCTCARHERYIDCPVHGDHPVKQVKASEPQCICATTAEPLRLVDPQCPKHSTRG